MAETFVCLIHLYIDHTYTETVSSDNLRSQNECMKKFVTKSSPWYSELVLVVYGKNTAVDPNFRE